MAMTKAERAHIEHLERELAVHKALAWPGYAAPESQPIPSGDGNATTTGWMSRAAVDIRVGVDECWSTSYSHGGGKAPDPNRSASKHGVRLSLTRLDALMTARVTATRQVAEQLAKLDAAIECERARPTTPSERE